MDDDLLRALQEQAHMLEELTKHPGWLVLVDYMHTKVIEPDTKRLLNGFIDDQYAYKHTVGRLSGAQAALNAPRVVREMVNAELERRAERAE